MGEFNPITDALDRELKTSNLGRRASDKVKHTELAALVEALGQADLDGLSNKFSSGTQLDKNGVAYSRDDVVRATDLFFELLATEENSSAPLRLLLDFVQRPVALSVQKTPSFFVDANHPARRLIKALFAREKDIVDQDNFQSDPVYQSLHASIGALVRDYMGDDRLFIQSYYEILRA